MKADSVGLEIFVKLSREELETLAEIPLTGEINFRDHASPPLKRKIPFSINYSPEQRDFLSVRQSPRDSYFGQANEVGFFINRDYREELLRYGSFGERFYGSGKLVIEIRN
ncbi:MAG: hypothetical protein Q8P81_01260 [Nanoarchaeota archaeon]|nr:hypothetical protein [Nanoarchaeota archaeon]